MVILRIRVVKICMFYLCWRRKINEYFCVNRRLGFDSYFEIMLVIFYFLLIVFSEKCLMVLFL